MKPLIVGRDNPYSDEPRHALAPLPRHSAGGRLCRDIMQLDVIEYMRNFDRTNLLMASDISNGHSGAPRELARERARQIVGRKTHDRIIMLGVDVARAFGCVSSTFFVVQRGTPMILGLPDREFPYDLEISWLVLPHPSGRCREWNDPVNYVRARHALRELCPEIFG